MAGRRRENAALRAERAERRLAMALELTQMIIWELDDETRQVRWWGDEQPLFDRPLTYEVIASDDLGLVHPDDRARVAACWRDHEKGGVARCEYRVNRPDGTLVWVSSSRETMVDSLGEQTGLIGVLRDITHKKVSEAALDAALEEATAASRAKSEFLANMSHEIRTPLNGVLGIAGALAMTELTPDQREMVDIIESSGVADGVLGLKTRQAARQWQKSRSLPADGYLTFWLIQRLKADAAKAAPGAVGQAG